MRITLFLSLVLLLCSACGGGGAAPLVSGEQVVPPPVVPPPPIVVPPEDGMVVYVSNSEGDDANSGLSADEPVQKLATAVALLRDGKPDWLLLRRGDVWPTESVRLNRDGKSTSEPIVVSDYGLPTLPRPTVKAVFLDADHVSVTDLIISGDGTGEGISFSFQGNHTGAHFEGVTIQKKKTGIDLRWVSNFVICRSVIRDCSSFGMYTDSVHSVVDGALIDECVFDNNGTGDLLNHNVYKSRGGRNYTFRNTIFSRGGNYGLKIRAWTENLKVENCLFVRNRNGMVVHLDKDDRTKGWTNTDVEITDCVFTDMGGDGQMILLGVTHAVNGVVRGNVLTNSTSVDWGYGLHLLEGYYADRMLKDVSVTNNTVYNVTGRTFRLIVGDTPVADVSNLSVERNLFKSIAQPRKDPLVNMDTLALNASTITGNAYNSHVASDAWFRVDGQSMPFSEWLETSSETSAQTTDVTFEDPTRSIASYNASLGGAATFEAFIAEARKQSRDQWRLAYTADAVNDYIRAGLRPTSDLGSVQIGAVPPK